MSGEMQFDSGKGRDFSQPFIQLLVLWVPGIPFTGSKEGGACG